MLHPLPLLFRCKYVNTATARIWLPTRRERRRQFQFTFATRAIELLVVGFLLLSSAQAQTSIVVYRTDKELVIGADSKTRFSKIADPNVIIDGKSTCKVRQVGSSFIAVAGHYNFDPYNIAISAFREHRSLADKAEAFKTEITEKLRVMLTKVRPTPLSSVIETTYPLVQATIFGVERGVPTYIVLTMNVDVSFSSASIRPSIYACPGDCESSLSYYPTGRREALDKLRTMIDPRFWKSFGPADGIRFLIMIEAEAASDEVAEPIDILRVTKSGACWYDHKKEGEGCETDIPKCRTPKPARAKRHGGK